MHLYLLVSILIICRRRGQPTIHSDSRKNNSTAAAVSILFLDNLKVSGSNAVVFNTSASLKIRSYSFIHSSFITNLPRLGRNVICNHPSRAVKPEAYSYTSRSHHTHSNSFGKMHKFEQSMTKPVVGVALYGGPPRVVLPLRLSSGL